MVLNISLIHMSMYLLYVDFHVLLDYMVLNISLIHVYLMMSLYFTFMCSQNTSTSKYKHLSVHMLLTFHL